MNQCIAIQRAVLRVPMDATNVLFLHCDQCNISDRVAYNPPTIQAAMVIPHLAFELMCLAAAAVIVMYYTYYMYQCLWISGRTNKDARQKRRKFISRSARNTRINVCHVKHPTHKFGLATS